MGRNMYTIHSVTAAVVVVVVVVVVAAAAAVVVVAVVVVYGSGVGSEGSRLEAWMKSHKSEVAIT